MKLGAFEISEPVPELNEPHVFAMLQPWINIGNVGTLVVSWLEAHYSAKPLGQLSRPGEFFDFTRYRPTTYMQNGQRQISIPNTTLSYSKQPSGNDYLFLHMLEPHAHGEDYVDSVLEVLQKFNAKRYCLIGSMYDYAPHTRPLTVTGGPGTKAQQDANRTNIRRSNYQGPTTITTLISQLAPPEMESMSLIVHLPQYTQLDDDFMGTVRVLEVLHDMYGTTVDQSYVTKADKQREQIDATLSENAQLKGIVEQLENYYDTQVEHRREQEGPRLSSEVEKFLSEMDRKFREDPGINHAD